MKHSASKTHGRVFLLAGGFGRRQPGPDPVMKAMIESLGLRLPRIAYIGAASGDDASFFKRISGLLTAAGAGPVDAVPLAGRRSVSASAQKILERADLLFLSGGDVEEGMRVLKACGAARVLCSLFRHGKPFMGLSAGSIMLGQSWIRWTDPDDDASADVFPCLGLAPFVCDTHDEESDWEELRRLLSLVPKKFIGYGIPSGAGLIVEPDGSVTACGQSSVCLA